MSIASASKWLYSAYAVQTLGGVAKLDSALDIPFLNFTSGYSQFGNGDCSDNTAGNINTETVQVCLNNNNSTQDPSTVGKFYYDSGHMEYHAANRTGLGNDDNVHLQSTVLDQDFDGGNSAADPYEYTQPLLAGGVYTDANSYAVFLRNILSGKLLMRDALGTSKVCTNPSTCTTAVYSPITVESWNYSIGHWVEDDPKVGDHAFSSAGAYGFYPWIDSSKTYYGIIAREVQSQNFEGYQSAECGRLIRQAWMTGVAVPASTITPTKPN
jgi:hypothetical protein